MTNFLCVSFLFPDERLFQRNVYFCFAAFLFLFFSFRLFLVFMNFAVERQKHFPVAILSDGEE